MALGPPCSRALLIAEGSNDQAHSSSASTLDAGAGPSRHVTTQGNSGRKGTLQPVTILITTNRGLPKTSQNSKLLKITRFKICMWASSPLLCPSGRRQNLCWPERGGQAPPWHSTCSRHTVHVLPTFFLIDLVSE